MAATLIGLSGIAARAQTDDEVSALIAEALLLSEWHTSFNTTFGLGYKDNVFLSHADPEGLPFFAVTGEFLRFRTAPVGLRASFFSNGEVRNFFGNGISHQEYTAFNQALLEYDFNPRLTGTLLGQYYYQNQILDISVTETNREPVPVRGHTFNVRPGARLNLPARLWLEVGAPLTRQFFDEPLDDYYESGCRVSVGATFPRAQITLSYEPLWRWYDTDPARTATGDAITNSHRFWFQQNVRLIWRHYWDEGRHWRTAATLGGRINSENGEGYSDYTKWFLAGRVEYRAHGWGITAEGRFGHYNYQTQTVSASNAAHRERFEWGAALTIERQLAEKLTALAGFEHETTDSNDPLETYSVNTVSVAVRWEF
jgi:hypothetical protein